jgi:hypothetical protein
MLDKKSEKLGDLIDVMQRKLSIIRNNGERDESARGV